MRSGKVIHVVSAHAEGEVGDVIVGGVAPPPGETLWEQSRFVASDGRLRSFVLNEPRGGVFRHVNLLVPPRRPEAQMGFIIMEPEDTPRCPARTACASPRCCWRPASSRCASRRRVSCWKPPAD